MKIALSNIFMMLAQQVASQQDGLVEVPVGDNAIEVTLKIGGVVAAEMAIGLREQPKIIRPDDAECIDLLTERPPTRDNVIAMPRLAQQN